MIPFGSLLPRRSVRSRWAGLLCVVLVGFGSSAVAQPVESVANREWRPGLRLTITTEEAVYDAVVVDPAKGRLDVITHRFGKPASATETIYLVGSTVGEQPGHGRMVFMRSVRVGFRMEFGRGSLSSVDREITAPVTSIEIGHWVVEEADAETSHREA